MLRRPDLNPPRPRLCGVLVTFRRAHQLELTLSRLSAQTRRLDTLVVVDNEDSDVVARLTRRSSGSAAAKTVYLAAGSNSGPAGGYAKGMTALLPDLEDADWIFLLDDDDPPYFDDTLERAESFAMEMTKSDPDIGGVGVSGGRFDLGVGKVIRIGDAELVAPVIVDHITGGGIPAYRVGAIRDTGVPLADLFFGFEELEYGLRMTAAGHTLYADSEVWLERRKAKRAKGELPPEEVSLRTSGRTAVRLGTASWRRYYSLRNLIFVLRQYDRNWTAVKVSLFRGIIKPLVNLPLHPSAAWRQLLLAIRAVRDGWMGRLGRTVEPT